MQKLLFGVRPAILVSFLKKIFRVKRKVVDTKNGRFFVDPVSNFGGAITCRGEYEPRMCQTLQHFLNPSRIFVDLGANEGYFSVIGAKLVGPSGKVIAIEPQKRLKAVLEKNFDLNQVNNVVLFDSCISNKRGTVKLYITPDTNTGTTALYRFIKYPLPTVTIDTITLSDLFSLAGIDEVDLLKMDIESYEYEAIMGSQELFKKRCIKALALEIHPTLISKRGLDQDDINHFLSSCGYQLDKRFSKVWTVHAT